MKKLEKVLVVGASRGIGKALAEELAQRGVCVTTTVRRHDSNMSSATYKTIFLDLIDPNAGEVIGTTILSDELDALVVNAGTFGPEHQDASLASQAEMADLFWINAIAPIRLARRLLSCVRPGGVVAFLSSRTASISLNNDGDMELYRASKAALNALARSFAIKDALPVGIGVLLLHPGWVQTDMGGENAPVTIADSVSGLYSVIKLAIDEPDFSFTDYLGHKIQW